MTIWDLEVEKEMKTWKNPCISFKLKSSLSVVWKPSRTCQSSQTGLLPEDVCSSAEEVLLLLVAVGAHPSLDDVEERLH